MNYKLGKKAKCADGRTLKLATYLAASLPAIPPAVDWSKAISFWGMMANDTLGDCTCAAAGHLEMLWTNDGGGKEFIPTDAQIITAYSAITGYNPDDPDSDEGANELDVLNFWRRNGIAGRKIFAYAELSPSNLNHVKASVAFFGGLYIGVQLPSSAMKAFDAGDDWTDIGDSQIEGGHALPIVAYDAEGLTCITWGRAQKMSWAWFQKYCDEAYCVLSPDWIGENGASPGGLNLAQLNSDLRAVTN